MDVLAISMAKHRRTLVTTAGGGGNRREAGSPAALGSAAEGGVRRRPGMAAAMPRHTGGSATDSLLSISTVVSIAEILKNNGFAVEKRITTSTVEIRDDSRGRTVQKAKIEIVLGKTANFDELMAAAKEALENGDGED
ncbi:Uncharacterized protein SHERM_12355 [Striga hermonthica]|uniref:Alba DNA/RNA-binding protein n=1 Tax=Striga hermonthica TaxID=68872 RepID=A0A9N7MI49_STRHE|nr:Uncharacterized protein SHERM_12355 [Striga hermonthica]